MKTTKKVLLTINNNPLTKNLGIEIDLRIILVATLSKFSNGESNMIP